MLHRGRMRGAAKRVTAPPRMLHRALDPAADASASTASQATIVATPVAARLLDPGKRACTAMGPTLSFTPCRPVSQGGRKASCPTALLRVAPIPNADAPRALTEIQASTAASRVRTASLAKGTGIPRRSAELARAAGRRFDDAFCPWLVRACRDGGSGAYAVVAVRYRAAQVQRAGRCESSELAVPRSLRVTPSPFTQTRESRPRARPTSTRADELRFVSALCLLC